MSHRQGPATRAELEELHRAVLETLLDRIGGSKRAGIEQLAVARAFLADNGFRGHWDMPATTRRKLQRLYKALCEQLEQAIEQESPSAGMLGEVRSFLAAQGIEKDAVAAAGKATTARAVKALGALDVPFKVTH